METSLDESKTIIGLDRVTTLNGDKLTDTSVSVPDGAEKREYPIEDSDGLNAMEDTFNSDPVQMKRESLNDEVDELNSLVSTDSPSGLMLITP